jgi:hypothetical protein
MSVRIINKLPQNAVIQIASSVWKTGSKDVRDVLKIAKLCNLSDGEKISNFDTSEISQNWGSIVVLDKIDLTQT